MLYKLAELTWPQAGEVLPKSIAVMAVGVIEQHGPHLPLDTDNLTAQAIVERALVIAGQHLDVVQCPHVQHGYTMHNLDFPGSMTVGYETMAHYMADLAASIGRHGCRKIVFLNGHGSNQGPLEMAARLVMNRYPELLVATAWPFGMATERLNEQREGSEPGAMAHACELETSTTLYLRPDLVHMEKAIRDMNQPPSSFYFRDLTKGSRGVSVPDLTRHISRTGAIGDPTLATAAKGEYYIRVMVEALVDFLHEFNRREVEQIANINVTGPPGLLPW